MNLTDWCINERHIGCEWLIKIKEYIMAAQSKNALLSWIESWNRKVSQFSIWDVKLAQIWTAAWLLLLLKLFPQIMQLSAWWFVLVIMLCAPRIFWLLFRKN